MLCRVLIISLLISGSALAQGASLLGEVLSEDGPVARAEVALSGMQQPMVAGDDGSFEFKDLKPGTYSLRVSSVGFKRLEKEVVLQAGVNRVKLHLEPGQLNLHDVVVSATRYEQDRRESPVIVNVLSPRLMNATQSLAVSEGLNYQPGVRVENNCQNCGFTQVRLNGLQGAYSQILINSRPVFSALNSVYGLDQIPSNMVKQVEVVRSGGSALYGSNAIAGTINIITRDPVNNHWQIGGNYGLIGGEASDHTLRYNGSFVNEELSSGISLYGMYRNRDSYDANGDGFTELTRIENNTFGGQAFYKPGKRSKISLNFNAIREYRRGGDQLDLAPHFTDITEETDHNTVIGGITYDLFDKSRRGKLSVYLSTQGTRRNSYYGGLGGGRTAADSALARNAYGVTSDLAAVGGLQYSRYFPNEDVLVVGTEGQYNRVEDHITGYNRLVDQSVGIGGIFAQYEWKPSKRFKALFGARYDHTLVDGLYRVDNIRRSVDQASTGVLSPRLTLMYHLHENLQFRGGYARGFRAPQAFNEDLHISSVGGEPQFVILSENLEKELSDAFTASLNYSQNYGRTEFKALVEGFHTRINNPFTTVSTGAVLPNGSIVEEVRNGEGASVSGVNFEFSFSPSEDYRLQLGGTAQNSRYEEPQVLYEPTATESNQEVVAVEEFIRTPRLYGYLASFWQISHSIGIDLTGTFTGPMIVPRVINQDGRIELRNSQSFLDANLKLIYDWHLGEDFEIELSAGVRNILNSFQDDFDTGPTRDSDYVYGPLNPRTYFFGITLGNIH